jgi:hypothetical protein
MKSILIILLIIFSHCCYAQLVEFSVKDVEGKPLKGVILSRYNLIVGISDSTGKMAAKSSKSNFRLHLTGYKDTSIFISPNLSEVVLNSTGEPRKPFKYKYHQPLEIQLIQRHNNFTVEPIDSTKEGDTVIEKVTRINVEAPCVAGSLIIAVQKANVAQKPQEQQLPVYEFVFYEDFNGRPGKSLISKPIKAAFYMSAMGTNLLDEQIVLHKGSYFVGYKRKVGGFVYMLKNKRIETDAYLDLKSSNGEPTFKKVNYGMWEPVLMPKSKAEKPKYYSFAHLVQLVKYK